MTSIGSLCTGYGGLDMAVELALGPVSHAWHAEVDPDASAVLAANWPGVPNLDDVTKVDFGAVEPVDILTAGYPCQPFSAAGLRKGTDDPRNRWPDVARAIRDLGPRLVVLENVRGHVRRGLPEVLADLAGLGYVGSWACVRASDVGAPHKRERVCVVAWPAASDPAQFGWGTHLQDDGAGESDAARRGHLTLLPTPTARDGSSGPGYAVSAQGGINLRTAVTLLPTPTAIYWARNATAFRTAPKPNTNTVGWTLADVAHADRWGEYGQAIARWEQALGRLAPEPTVSGGSTGKQLSPLFVEWMMGLPEGHVTKHLSEISPKNGRRQPTRVRSAALRLLGNGVVPLQLAHGIRSQLSSLTGAVAA